MFSDADWSEETRRLGPPVGEMDRGARVDEYLAGRFPFFSRSGWQREIESGVVLINGGRARKPSQRLQMGDELRRLHPLDEEPDVDTSIYILWCDGDIAAVYKPAGLPMHESGYYRRKTVAGVLPRVLGSGWTPVHRLDRETSGILVCARNGVLRAKLTEIWTHRRVQKTYFAITKGVPSEKHWMVHLPIKSERFVRTNKAAVSSDGDPAETEFYLLSTSKDYACVEAKPFTGRTNQIRIHLEASGYPILGDKIYGQSAGIFERYRKEGNSPEVQQMAGFKRHALHAWKISFEHPLSKKEVFISTPIPEDLKEFCAQNGLYLNFSH